MDVKTNNKIDDLEEFSKLFKINIPVKDHFKYYLETLSKSEEYKDIDSVIDDFYNLENFAKSNGYSSARSYKLSYAIPKLSEYIVNTSAFKKAKAVKDFMSCSTKLYSKDEIKKNLGKNFAYLSFDISKANYSILKSLDKEFNELYDSWEDLCFHLDIHPTLIKSKSFRQIVFGNTNPKLLQTLQHLNISNAIQYIKLKGLSEDNISFISHDEIILRFNMEDPYDLYLLSLYNNEDTIEEISNSMNELKVKSNLYDLKKVGKDILLKNFLSYDKKKGFTKLYSSLHGVPGNKFYKYFKLYILKEELDERDLYFINDGEIAKWSTDDDSVAGICYPKGELTLEEVKLKHNYYFDLLSKSIPGLTDFQKRKIIDIAKNKICKNCFNSDIKCDCYL